MLIFMLTEEKQHTDSEQLDGLIQSIAKGDRDALAKLYHASSKQVYGFALSIVKNSADAEDVLHDTFIRIYNSSSLYKSNGKPMAWIMTITKNLATQVLRDRARQGESKDEAFDDFKASAEDRIVLQACMKLLDDESRQILILHALSGFKHREIAQMLDLALPTVLSKYHRAIKKLRNHLQQEEHYE
ncbi:MAG: RNA polymerase sigma factor [Clostridia bacterium]|nr:RNA polymerase sigma factor [Clostridia bacterium]